MHETRDAFVKKTKAKLDEWNAEISMLEAKARQKEADIQASYRRQIDSLKTRREKVAKDLEKINHAGGDAWQDLRAGMSLAADSLREALHSAWTRFQ